MSEMRTIVIAAIMLVLAFSAPASAGSTLVFQAQGSVHAPFCYSCAWLLDQATGGGASEATPDGLEEDLIEGAVSRGANHFILHAEPGPVPYTEAEVIFLDANGFVLRRYANPGDETGPIPPGAAGVLVRVAFGANLDYTYREYLRT